VKKTLLLSLGLLLLLAACNRKAFVKKLVGTYTLDKYLFDGQSKTVQFDTTFREWKLQLADDELYAKTWKEYVLRTDTFFLADTLGYDSISMMYLVNIDTVHIIDTNIVGRIETGKWDLINSEEDLQLRNDSTNTGEIYRILELKQNNLTLRKGNEELYLKK
jgi:hypothetical protein